MKYRPDIDGLRAIAILLVLIYHGGLSLFPSGFIGVDVFFVISGFLITGIIHDSLNNNHFSFVDFYNRRLWRLQPYWYAFAVCVATGFLIGLGSFYPAEAVVKLLSLRPLVFIGVLSYSLYILALDCIFNFKVPKHSRDSLHFVNSV